MCFHPPCHPGIGRPIQKLIVVPPYRQCNHELVLDQLEGTANWFHNRSVLLITSLKNNCSNMEACLQRKDDEQEDQKTDRQLSVVKAAYGGGGGCQANFQALLWHAAKER
jgi:hypothetical protein